MRKETWKPVKGFEGAYEVSDLGNIRSLHNVESSPMKPTKNYLGYLKIVLFKDGVPYYRTVHRLVADAFLPNPEKCPQINHINEDKADNRASNLEWCTAKYNANFGTRNDRIKKALTNKYGRGVYQFSLDGEFIAEYPSLSEAGRAVNASPSSIRHSCLGHRGPVSGFLWEFA